MKTSSRRPIPRTLLCASISLLATQPSARAVTFDTSSGDIIQSSPITGEGLTKTGTGTLTLTQTNAFTGEVAVNDGTLAINVAEALAGASVVTVNASRAIQGVTFTSFTTGGTVGTGGTISLSPTGGFGVIGGTIGGTTGGGTLSVIAPAGITLAGTFLPAGQYTITNSTTLTSVADPSQTYTFPGSPAKNGVLALNTAVAGLDSVKVFGGTINGGGSLSANTLFIRNGTVSAAITGATRVIVGEEGSTAVLIPSTDVGGPAVLAGNNTYTGGTWLNSGTLDVRSASALGAGDITVKGTTGSVANNTLSVPASFTNPAESGTGTGSDLSCGTMLSGSNTYSGTVTVTAGALLSNGASASLVISGSGTLTLNPGTPILVGDSPGVTTIPRSGTLNLSAEVATPGKLTLDGGSITGTGSLNASAFDVRAGGVTARLTGSGGLTKSGTGTVWLTGANDYTGGTTVQAGRLDVSAAGALNGGPVSVTDGLLIVSAAQNLTRLDTSATGQLGINAGETRVHAGTLAGNLVVAAGATLTLDGTARIAQPENGHPGNYVQGPSGGETLATSVLLVNGTLKLVSDSHQLGLLAGSGDILVGSAASYSVVMSRFTGRWFLEGGAAAGPAPGSTPAPEATGDLRMDGLIYIEQQGAGTQRIMTFGGDGEASVTSDWTNQGSIRIGERITFNLGRGVAHSVDSSLVQIGADATLKGLGSISGSLVNHGRVAPGNSPGVITVGGDFTNGPTGVVDIEIGGTAPGTQYDVIRYSGSAILNGGTLNLTLINSYAPGSPVALRILEDTDTAAGSPSVSGGFTTVNRPSGLYTTLTADDAGLLVRLSPTLAGMGVAPHDGLAGADRAAARQPALFGALDAALTAGGSPAAANALQALSPIGLTAMPALALDAASGDARVVLDRADSHRRMAAARDDAWETFVGYAGRFADTEGGRSAPVFDSSVQLGHVGLEKAVGENLVFGLMPGYAHGKATLSAGAGDVTLERAGLTAYAAFVEGETVAQLGVRGAYLDYETRRSHALGRDSGATHGYDAGAFAGLSHAFRVGDFALTPETSVRYTRAEISGFDESGTAAALRVKSATQDSVRARIGLGCDWIPLNTADSRLAVGLAVGAEHELLDNDGEIRAAYAGGTRFATESALGAETTVDVGPRVRWTFAQTHSVSAGYRYEYGFDDTTAHRVDLAYSKRF